MNVLSPKESRRPNGSHSSHKGISWPFFRCTSAVPPYNGVGRMHREPKASRPEPSGKNETGDFAQFTDFMRRLVSVPHSEIQRRLAEEKRARKPRRASSSHDPASS